MRTSICAVASVALFAGLSAGATVEGVVRDSQGRPAAAATLYLESKASGQTLTAHPDTQGRYRFPSLPAGSYALRAQAADAGEAAAAFALASEDSKHVDLVLQPVVHDQLGFTIAGVTDTMSQGGHGSDAILRSADALALATAALVNSSTPAAAEEQEGHALEAVREYQRAAEAEPSETHLFDWGAELLKHRAFEPAEAVFTKGNRLFPRSLRMWLGLAAANYARGSYDQAAARFFAACDLEPENPQPYMFLGKTQASEIAQLPGYLERMKRFASRHPENAWASYYYAASLWKQREGPDDLATAQRTQELLERAIGIDPVLGAAYLLTGIVYAAQSDYARARGAYEKAIAASPELEEAHYRLGLVYQRLGEKEKAAKELAAYDQMSRQSAEAAQRERAQIRQFVYELRNR